MEEINNIKIECTAIKKDIEHITKDISEIKTSIRHMDTNCIPTITKQLAKLDANQKLLLWFMMAIVATLIGLFFR
jgi:prefoldin subunit 5